MKRNTYKYVSFKRYMDIQLGSKEARKEISLGRVGSIIFLVIFLALMLVIAYGLWEFFLKPEDSGQTYIRCIDGSIEKIEKDKFEYCGEFVGADTPQGIREYLEKIKGINTQTQDNNFGINIREDLGLISVEE